ncbi:DNA translocase FtsK [Patescibacteria group bacterium]|nr:DNA translocase FtsK [Patescibacteria group bacterium]
MKLFKRRKRRYNKRYDDRIIGMGISVETKRSIAAIAFMVLGGVAFLSWMGIAGVVGEYVDQYLAMGFGRIRWMIAIILVILGYILMRPVKYPVALSNIAGLALLVLSFFGLSHLTIHSKDLVEAAKDGLGGGYIGVAFSFPLMRLLGFWASFLILLALNVIALLITFNTTLSNLSQPLVKIRTLQLSISEMLLKRKIKAAQKQKETQVFESEDPEEQPEPEPEFTQKEIESVEVDVDDEEEFEGDQLSMSMKSYTGPKIEIPIDLLNGTTGKPTSGDIKANSLIIQSTLANFGINVEMGEVNVGPTVTQYTFKPAEGVKLSKITTLHNDLALALAVHPIRIEAPIPGRSLVGIEVPNQTKANVPLKEILVSDEFKKHKTHLNIGIGKDVKGMPYLANLAKMPHLLIAGSTGSGKSVAIKSIIVSLLYQNHPGQLKLILVDPKRVELPIYNGIPHLLTPVITDVEKTVNSLKWAINEMERRFDILAEVKARDLQTYHSLGHTDLPYIVIIIDELADLMAARGPEVEAAIIRLAQMSRAVGIHLILATQRPSVDVITGLIKANISSRIAFSVASLVDSRTILDMSGAEKLLGRGDMLFTTAELGKPKRLQGAFCSDVEIHKIVEFLKSKAKPEYLEEVIEKQRGKSQFSGEYSYEDGDELLGEAKQVIVQAGKASASLLQRRLRVGYARAARILDLLEAQGFIGPADGAKPREILSAEIAEEDYEEPEEEVSEEWQGEEE